MICKQCGQENGDVSKFCIGCGAALDAEAPVEQTVAAPAQAVAEPVQTVAEPVQTPPQTNPYYQPIQQQPPMGQTPPYWQQPPVPQQTGEKPVSFGKWMGVMALEYFLGFVYLIMLFVWGFSSSTEESLKNYARARLVWTAIGIVFVILVVVLLLSSVSAWRTL